MRIGLTGTTGLLGRNIFFEILKNCFTTNEPLEIIVFGKNILTTKLKERIRSILEEDGIHYIGIKDIEKLLDKITTVHCDLSQDGLAIPFDNLKYLQIKKIDIFIHSGALTDFRNSPEVAVNLQNINVKGTERLLKLLSITGVKTFIYISSAYACGSKSGKIFPDYSNTEEVFRNPYEKTKLLAELVVQKFAKEFKFNYKIIRPSTIAGRLIESPIGMTPKFDIFYAWTAFFLRIKLAFIKNPLNIFEEEMLISARIAFCRETGLNIVPADYAAKVIWGIANSQTKDIFFHITNPTDTMNIDYTSWALKSIGISGFEIVDQEPENKNKIEKFYYKTVGKIFTPYAMAKEKVFLNRGTTEKIEEKLGIKCPTIDKGSFDKLMTFAKSKHFGLKL